MISNRNILCLSSTGWGGNYIKATVELMKELSVKNRLLFVNSPYTFKDIADGIRGKKKDIEFKRAFGLKKRLQTIKLDNGGTVYVLTPPVTLSINFLPPGKIYQALLAFNGWVLRRTAQRALRRLNMTDKLINFIPFNPAMGVATGRKFKEYSLIYHCYDEIRGADPWIKKHGVAQENLFLQMADGVIVTSQGLYDHKKDMCKRCYIVKNAVNFNLFSKGFNAGEKPEKVIGYIGSIDDRLDYPLLDYLIKQLPGVRFVFVGRVSTLSGTTHLNNYPNVTLTGAKTPDELPGYLATFSAGIIPFISDEFTRGIYPMKINEYLAAGLPVVSTNFSDLSDFADIIRITNKQEAFLDYLKNELATDNPEKRSARQDVARKNTWAVRAVELSEAIEKIEAKHTAS